MIAKVPSRIVGKWWDLPIWAEISTSTSHLLLTVENTNSPRMQAAWPRRMKERSGAQRLMNWSTISVIQLAVGKLVAQWFGSASWKETVLQSRFVCWHSIFCFGLRMSMCENWKSYQSWVVSSPNHSDHRWYHTPQIKWQRLTTVELLCTLELASAQADRFTSF